MSVELIAPPLLIEGALKEHDSPAGNVEGHEKMSEAGVSTVVPVGVTVTVTLPAVFGASDSELGLIVVVNDPDRVIVKGAIVAAA